MDFVPNLMHFVYLKLVQHHKIAHIYRIAHILTIATTTKQAASISCTLNIPDFVHTQEKTEQKTELDELEKRNIPFFFSLALLFFFLFEEKGLKCLRLWLVDFGHIHISIGARKHQQTIT